MSPQEYFRLQFNLEGKDLDPEGYTFQFKEVEGEALPRVCILDFGNQVTLYLARGLKPELEAALRQLPLGTLLHQEDQIKALLAQEQPCQEVSQFVTYIFPNALNEGAEVDVIRFTEPHYPLLVAFGHGFDGWEDTPVFGLNQEGKIVSACVSSRENERAGEAWVLTLPEYRGQGYAGRAVLAWQYDLKRRGKVPFYSHHQANLASAALAKKLGLKKIYSQTVYV